MFSFGFLIVLFFYASSIVVILEGIIAILESILWLLSVEW